MLRLIHSQTVEGAILVDDIDDGLPNKNVHRLGSMGDPKAYARDGYANAPKQQSYIPKTKVGDAAVAGYIDLRETQRVLLSASNGKIAGLQRAGLISVVSLTSSDLAAPVVTAAELDNGDSEDVTITGTGFLSVAPEVSRVILTGDGAVTLTRDAILAGSGTFTDTSIVIPASLCPGVAAADTSVQVVADAQESEEEALANAN